MRLDDGEVLHELNPSAGSKQEFEVSNVSGPSSGLYPWSYESRVDQVILICFESIGIAEWIVEIVADQF